MNEKIKQKTRINKIVVVQKTDRASTIPVFHVGIITLDLFNLAWGGVRSILYKKEKALYNISDYKKYENFQTLDELVNEIYKGFEGSNKEELAFRLFGKSLGKDLY